MYSCFKKTYTLIAFYQHTVELWCQAKYFSNVPRILDGGSVARFVKQLSVCKEKITLHDNNSISN